MPRDPKSLPDHDVLYAALIARDPAYDGFVFVCVTSTRVFCRLTRAARKLKRENTRCFRSVVECVQSGYRACLRCRPLAPANERDPLVKALLTALNEEPDKRWSEPAVIALGYDPSTVRRASDDHIEIDRHCYTGGSNLLVKCPWGSSRQHGESILIVADLSETAMPKRLLICSELSPAELREQAFTAGTPRERKRAEAIAHVMEGMSRVEAGRLTDQTDQAVKDAIRRYNTEGFVDLKDRPHTGRPRKFSAAQRQELRDIALKRPDVETEHFSTYTREDIAAIAKEKWAVTYAVTSIGRLLREQGLSRQKIRPSHSKKDSEAVEAF